MSSDELISTMIVALNALTVSGVHNMQIVIETINKLGALQKGLREEHEANAQQIAELNRRLAERPPVRFNEDGTITLGGETIDLDGGGIADADSAAE